MQIQDIYSKLSSSNNNLFVVVAGNIGCGKTTLTNKLAQQFSWKPLFESVDGNPFLEPFYKDMKRWAYHLQTYFLTHRFNTHRAISLSNSSSIQDRSIYEDCHIFAKALYHQGMMSKEEYESYMTLYNTMIQFLSPPDIMIFLKRSVPKLMERIALRNRECERDISMEYIDMLNSYYNEWYDSYDLGKKIIVDTDDLDFLCNNSHFDRLALRLNDSIEQPNLFSSYY